MDNKRKIVLITGASRGLGRACALKFASLNYDIVLNYNNSKNKALKLKEEIENKYNVSVMLIKADVSNELEVIEMIREVKEKFGYITCLVNNAAISMDNEIKDKSVDEFRKVVGVNLIGAFIVSKYASSIMNFGSIINVTSTDAIDTCYKEELDYAASKAGLISLTKTLAKQFAPNIRVNAVAPGWINTDMNSDMFVDFKDEEIDKILLKRFAEPEEVANVIAFLDSVDASYINSTVIRVDGGI